MIEIKDPHELTPIEQHGDLFFKREDYFSFAGCRGGKVRSALHIAQGAKGLISAGSSHSPQVIIVARIAHELDIPARVHIPKCKRNAELEAIAPFTEIIEHKIGRRNVLSHDAAIDAKEHPDWTYIPFGMEHPAHIEQMRSQFKNVPAEAKRIVAPVGSGLALSAILWGARDYGWQKPIVGICVSPLSGPIKMLDKYAPHDWREQCKLIRSELDYAKEPEQQTISGIQLDPIYEAKAIPYLEAGDLFWIVGIRRGFDGDRAASPAAAAAQLSRSKEISELEVDISQLEAWERNPRGIRRKDLERLKEQIRKLGVYKRLICYEKENAAGRFVILGGNMRYRALQELGAQSVSITIVRPRNEAEKLEYNLSDNDQAGFYEEDQLFERFSDQLAEINLSTFGVDFREPKTLAQAVKDFYGDDVIFESEARWDEKQFAAEASRIIKGMSFPYRTLSDFDLIRDFADLCWTDAKYSNAGLRICNELQPTIWQIKSGNKKLVLSEVWDERKEEIIEYLLARRGEMTDSLYQIRNLLCLLKSIQRPWVFKPALARFYYRRYSKPGDLIFDPSIGWGSRMLGYLSLGRSEQFMGTDPSPEAIRDNKKILSFLKINNQAAKLICEPFEDFEIGALRGKIGFIITSPPYFDTEEYTGEKQSWRRYPDLEQWKERFLKVYIGRCGLLLRPGGYFVLNIGNVGKQRIDISEDIKRYLTVTGFEIEKIETEIVSRVVSEDISEQQRGEPFYIAKKREKK